MSVNDPYFDPRVVAVAAGANVSWSRAANSIDRHNIREDHALFRSGDPTYGPINFARNFSAGSFHYYCEIHSGGMYGEVRVAPRIGTGPSGLPFTVRWATTTTNTGSVFDVQYRVGAGDWRRWRTDTVAVKGVFGDDGSPQRVVAGTRYFFRARSQKGTQAGAPASFYSPAKVFIP